MDITEYYVLAKQIARKEYARLRQATSAAIELQDLEAAAYNGLLQAGRNFDPGRGVAFHSYAQKRIRGAILDHLRGVGPVSQEKYQKVKKLNAIKENLRKQLEREPYIDELSAVTGKTEAEIREIEEWGNIRVHPVSSLEGTESEGSNLLEEIATEEPGPDIDLIRKELGRDVNDCMDEVLSETEGRVIVSRFLGKVTLDTIGEKLGKPKQTIFNISKRAQRKLKDCLKGKGWSVDDALSVF